MATTPRLRLTAPKNNYTPEELWQAAVLLIHFESSILVLAPPHRTTDDGEQ